MLYLFSVNRNHYALRTKFLRGFGNKFRVMDSGRVNRHFVGASVK